MISKEKAAQKSADLSVAHARVCERAAAIKHHAHLNRKAEKGIREYVRRPGGCEKPGIPKPLEWELKRKTGRKKRERVLSQVWPAGKEACSWTAGGGMIFPDFKRSDFCR